MAEQRVSERLVSLDAFRGATMALMVLVNNAGDGKHVYGPLEHAAWHGWTITDTVFPSFMWIVGVAITLSMGKRKAAGGSRMDLMKQALRRGFIIYCLGLLVYMFPRFDFSTMRVLGVLQRIGICYVAATAIYLTTKVRGQVLWIAGLLAGYWAVMAFAPVPGYGSGRLDVEGNFAHYVDSVVLGAHNYRETKTWDPEGVVSTLPALATVLLGIMAGHILRLKKELSERTTWLFFTGALLLAAGLVCDTWLPINKKLWTSSFALFMGGLDFIVFAMFAWWIDGLGRKKAVRPLVILGMNAIAVYLTAELFAETLNSIRWTEGAGMVSVQGWLYRTLFTPLASPYNASALWAVSFTLLMYGVAWVMHRKGWFLKV
jgi:predicted acyltransferase